MKPEARRCSEESGREALHDVLALSLKRELGIKCLLHCTYTLVMGRLDFIQFTRGMFEFGYTPTIFSACS